MLPNTVKLAFEEVRKYHPEAELLVLNSNQRWQFMGEDFEKIVFHPDIESGILEDMFHEVQVLPTCFEYQEESDDRPIKDIKVTRTMVYSSDFYEECWEEDGETPTQEGFLEFIQSGIDEDFFTNRTNTQEIEYV